MNCYKAFYKGKEYKVNANSSYEAQKKIAQEYKIKKAYLITIVLCEKEGKQVIHKPLF